MVIKLRERPQITLPAEIVKKLNIKTGDHLEVKLEDNRIIVTPVLVIDRSQAWFWSKKWQDMEREAEEDSLDKIKIVIRKSFPSLFKDKKIKGRNYIFESSINMSTGITWQYKDGGILLQIIGPHNFTLSNP